MILSVHHISKAFLEVPVLQDITFHLEKGDRAAIIGSNGAGKTTLLRIITGELTPDEGTCAFARGTSWGYLAQEQNIDSGNTIFEELLTVKQNVVRMEQRLQVLEHMMEQLSGEDLTGVIEEYNDLTQRFQRENGYAFRGEITGVLRGLGFTDDEFGKSVRTLSGGQKTRVALAKLLLEKPELIFLDEPTNHLDIDAIRWLENYLSSYRGTVLLVSHDRYFLDRTVTQIIEIENTKARLFRGNYSFYAEHKQALREQERHQYLNNQAQIRHQEEVIAKLKQFNREKSIKRAESRQKQLSRMQVLERPVELRDDMRLILKPCIRSGRDVMQARGIAKSFGDNLLYRDLTFDIRRGEHVAVIGGNGTGKSTLLKIIIGQLASDSGTIRFGTNVHLGYYDQEHHVLNEENTIFEEISDACPDMTNTEIRSLLASFLFTGEDVFKRIADLSGGEKGRVSLARLMLSEANFLLLDEPTNHLDMTSREVLENALNSYEGTVLCVSHDRYFMNRTASRILSLRDHLLLDYPGCREGDPAPDCYIGNYDYYLEKSAQVEGSLREQELQRIGGTSLSGAGKTAMPSAGAAGSVRIAAPAAGEAASGGDAYRRQKEEQARIRKQQNDLRKCEEEIERLETRSAAIDEEMALPENCMNITKLNELQKEKESVEERMAEWYDKWEALSS